jgi:protein-tyrosine-phosphatase
VAIPDPIGGPDEEYEETFRLLDELIGRTLERLAPVLSR